MRPTAGPSSIRSSGATRGKKIGLTRTGVKTRELAFRDRFVAARSVTRRDGLVKFIESLKRKRLTKRAWIQESAKVGVFAINNTKPSTEQAGSRGFAWPLRSGSTGRIEREGPFLGPDEES